MSTAVRSNRNAADIELDVIQRHVEEHGQESIGTRLTRLPQSNVSPQSRLVSEAPSVAYGVRDELFQLPADLGPHLRSDVQVGAAVQLRRKSSFISFLQDDSLESMNRHFAVYGSIVALAVATSALAQQPKFPPLKRQDSTEAVVKEHMAALNACDWNRLLAQDAPDAEIFSPDGVLAQGREAVGAMFAQVVKPFREGGICGLKFTAEHTQKVGDTLNVQWRADAPFLSQPYRGADAYETKDGLMQAQVTTFKREDLKTK